MRRAEHVAHRELKFDRNDVSTDDESDVTDEVKSRSPINVLGLNYWTNSHQGTLHHFRGHHDHGLPLTYLPEHLWRAVLALERKRSLKKQRRLQLYCMCTIYIHAVYAAYAYCLCISCLPRVK